jgi:farnesyl diphosphate synthase
VDDILDVTSHPAELGKTVGKDAEQGKPTYVSLMGLAAANAYSQTLLNQALTALGSIQQPGTEALRHLAKELVDRQS